MLIRPALLFLFLFMIQPLCAQIESLRSKAMDSSVSDSIRIRALERLSTSVYGFNNPDSAIFFGKIWLDLARKAQYQKQEAISLNALGGSMFSKGDHVNALLYFHEALDLSERIGYQKGISKGLNNLATIYAQLNDHGKALELFQRSARLHEAAGDTLAMMSSYGNIGATYAFEGKYDQAMIYFERMLLLAESVGEDIEAAVAHMSIGSIHLYSDRYQEALTSYVKAREVFVEKGITPSLIHCLGHTAGAYHALGDIEQAIKYAEHSLALATQLGMLLEQREASMNLYKFHRELGKSEMALSYHERGIRLTDSLDREELTRTLQQMEFKQQLMADSLRKEEEKLQVQLAHQDQVRQKDRTRNIFMGSSIFVLLVAGGLWSRLRYTRRAKAIIEKERDRSDTLLLNILPSEIAEELKTKGRADARDFEMVSIIFTDFKGFTEASARMNAQELVSEINTCFEAFDAIMGRHGIEKIKTIGDAYMAAGGLPVPDENSVIRTVMAALEMRDFILELKREREEQGRPAFEMRIGIHTGPVVAGIVGVKKFQYDIWGDTVNTASRMESNGEVGRVNISETTYELLKGSPGLTFTPRGRTTVKGKGEIVMYFVEREFMR